MARGRYVAAGGMGSAKHALLISPQTLTADSTPGDAEGPVGSVLGALRWSQREREAQTPQQDPRFSFKCQQSPVLMIPLPSCSRGGHSLLGAGNGWWSVHQRAPSTVPWVLCLHAHV